MDTSRQDRYAADRRSGSRPALLGLGLALVAAVPYATFFVGMQIWQPPEEWPSVLADGVIWAGVLSPLAGLVGCFVGIDAFRTATRHRERVIAGVATAVSALAVAAFAFVMYALSELQT
jgi:hypothetical protein